MLMYFIQANLDTVLKRTPDQSSGLAANEKVSVPMGMKIPVERWEEASGFHYRVFIRDGEGLNIPAGWWYFFDQNEQPQWDHWRLSWDDDSQEKESEKPLSVISQVASTTVLGADLEPNSSFEERLSPHITYGEFCLHKEARRFYTQHQINTAVEICQFLERCRAHFGGHPLKITSGHRPPQINAQIGGASRSEHLFDAPNVGAVDICIPEVNIYQLQDYCDREWPYSVGYGAKKGFVHVGIRRGRPRVRWVY